MLSTYFLNKIIKNIIENGKEEEETKHHNHVLEHISHKNALKTTLITLHKLKL